MFENLKFEGTWDYKKWSGLEEWGERVGTMIRLDLYLQKGSKGRIYCHYTPIWN